MANTLTNLIPVVYEAINVVSREITGFIPSVYLDATADMVAKDQTITYPVVGSYTAADIAAAATGPDPSDTAVGNGTLSISKSRGVTFYWTGEEQMGLGGLYGKILRDQFAQGMRTLANEIEADIAALHVLSSRSYGTAGTTPFASTLGDPAQMRKILTDNGTSMSDLQLVINSAAGANLRTLATMNALEEMGTTALRERGTLLNVHGFTIRESAQVKTTAAVGNNTGTYAVNGAHAVGVTTITVKTGTGTILAGDIITFGGSDVNQYVVTTGVSNGTTIVLGAPGLRVALAGNEAVAIKAVSTRNMAFDRGAIHLLTRIPAMPAGGDDADDVIVVTDPVSNISFQVAMYRQRRRVAFEIGTAWGVKMVNPEHTAILAG